MKLKLYFQNGETEVVDIYRYTVIDDFEYTKESMKAIHKNLDWIEKELANITKQIDNLIKELKK